MVWGRSFVICDGSSSTLSLSDIWFPGKQVGILTFSNTYNNILTDFYIKHEHEWSFDLKATKKKAKEIHVRKVKIQALYKKIRRDRSAKQSKGQKVSVQNIERLNLKCILLKMFSILIFQKLNNFFLYTKLVHNENFMIPKSNNLMRTWASIQHLTMLQC